MGGATGVQVQDEGLVPPVEDEAGYVGPGHLGELAAEDGLELDQLGKDEV